MAGEPVAEHPQPVEQVCDATSTLIADRHAGVALASGEGSTGALASDSQLQAVDMSDSGSAR